jgi:hypothetical protein
LLKGADHGVPAVAHTAAKPDRLQQPSGGEVLDMLDRAAENLRELGFGSDERELSPVRV